MLILSEFAGAAEELREALSVNAYDIDSIADAHAPRARHAAARTPSGGCGRCGERVIIYDVQRWAAHFVDAPGRAIRRLNGAPRSAAAMRETVDQIRAGGTDRDHPRLRWHAGPDRRYAGRQRSPDPELLQLIGALADRPNTLVLMVSGRPRDTLEAWFGALPIELWAEHGVWFKPAQSTVWAATVDDVGGEWLAIARARMEEFARTTPGAFVEVKTSAVAWHYRRTARGFGRAQARDLRFALSAALADYPAEIIEGKRVLEVRPKGATKAAVVQRLLSRHPPPALIVAFGDDRTDEEVFAALPRNGISVHVGSGASLATHRLRNPAAVRAFLVAIAEQDPVAGTRPPDDEAAPKPTIAK